VIFAKCRESRDFAGNLLPKSVCFVTYWLNNMSPWRQNFTHENLALHVMMVVTRQC